MEKRNEGVERKREKQWTKDGSPKRAKDDSHRAETLWSDEKPQLLNYEWVRRLAGEGVGAAEERSGVCDGQLHAAWACNCSL